MYPSLAGQHASYIERAIQEYQTGYRKNPIMNGMVASLKPADIAAIANYFSSLKPGLHTESRPYFRWTDHAASRASGSGPPFHCTCTGTKIRVPPRWISRATWPRDFSTAVRSCSTVETRRPLAASTTSPG